MKKLVILFLILYCPLFFAKAQWVQMSNGIELGVDESVRSFTTLGNNIFAGTYQHGVYISTNNGTSWTQTTLDTKIIYSLATLGNSLLAGTADSGIYISTNNGINWSQTALNNQRIRSFTTLGNNIFAGTGYYTNGGVFRSTDYGISWTQSGLSNYAVWSLATLGNNIFAGTADSGIYLSTDNGTNWTQTALNNGRVLSFTVSGNNIFAGTWDGVFLSTNNGINWVQTFLYNEYINSLASRENNIFAGTYQQGIYVSTNNGTNWAQKNEGIYQSTIYIFGILITNDYIFIGINDWHSSVRRRNLSEILGVKPISEIIPLTYSLHQNYPNPFNPATKIKFDIASEIKRKTLDVKLVIYDILGKVIATLVNEQLQSGTYEVTFDGSNLSSGIYFYKLTTNNYIETKKMLMIK